MAKLQEELETMRPLLEEAVTESVVTMEKITVDTVRCQLRKLGEYSRVLYERDNLVMGNVACSKLLHLILSIHIIIEPHGRGVPEAILNGCSPRPGLPK